MDDLAAAFLPDGRPRRPLALSLLALFDALAGLITPGAMALVDLFLPSRLTLLVGPVFGGLCWGAAWRIWRLQPGGRALQIVVCCLGMLAVPPYSTILFLPVLFLALRPAVGLLLSGKLLPQLAPAEVERVVRFVSGSQGWARGVLIAAVSGLGVLAVLGYAFLSLAHFAWQSGEPTRVANEAAVLAEIRLLLEAEARYAAGNGGLYDVLQRVGSAKGQEAGYSRRFHAGAPADPGEIARQRLSPSSIRAFAYVAVPLRPGETGRRAFCGDATGLVRFNPDGTPPDVADGACPTSWLILYPRAGR